MGDRKQILVVEDEAMISILYGDILLDSEFEMVAALTCNKHALDWIDNHRPDLAIVDYVLADGACHPLIARLTELGIPFIVASGWDRSRVTDIKAFDWIAKPFTPDSLLKKLRALPGMGASATRSAEKPRGFAGGSEQSPSS